MPRILFLTNGVRQMLKMVGQPATDALVMCPISGAGSALMPIPIEGVQLTDKQEVTPLLPKSGADIDEINIVRKHLSAIKGGRLS